ncbi:MAG: FkbM family methyltransferase [Chloroflexi bacterium]|nr:MAG: FkbM family methyltransferase [Chloroflexota bacterium]
MNVASRLTALAATATRTIQVATPHRPVKGLSRMTDVLHRLLPEYRGIIRLHDGLRFAVNSRHPSERRILFTGDYQPALTALLHNHVTTGAYCLDIGANLGFYTLKMAHWAGPNGRVAAFEANPDLLPYLNKNIQLNHFDHVSVMQKAISDELGESTFYIAPNIGKSSLNPQRVEHPERMVTVERTTIDRFIEQQRWLRLDVIKMDIESHDCYGLLGARQTIGRFRPVIVFEFWRTTPGDIAENAIALLHKHDYALFELGRYGGLARFDYHIFMQHPSHKHIDIVCLPPT